MKLFRWHTVIGLMTILTVLPVTRAQQKQNQNGPHIGYVYPAGGKAGTTFEVVIGGQFLTGLTNVFISGGGIQATITDLIRPITGKELNDLRIKMDELLARKAVVKNDFKALENFRSFKNAKSIKDDKSDNKKNDATDDKEIEELKKKYANATWTAEDDRLINEVRRKISTNVRRPDNPAISEIATVQVTVDPDAKSGDREVRLGTPQGLTNPMLFKVGQMPEFSKPAVKNLRSKITFKEVQMGLQSKIAKEKAEAKITLPVVVNGQIMPGAVDRFRFTARKGMRLVLASSARELIPYLADAVPGWFQATLTLYDSSGKEVAYDDDFRFNPDPVLYYEIPDDGDYVLEIKDSIYRGREDFVYRIVISEMPFITSIFPLGGPANASTMIELKGWNLPVTRMTVDNHDKTAGIYPVSVRKDDLVSNFAPFAVDNLPECVEKEPNSQHRTAQTLNLPVIVNGNIDHPDDRDFFKFEGKAGDEIIAEVNARRLNSPLDSKLVLSDSQGKEIVFNDDCEDKGSGLETHHADSCLRAKLPADGTYFVEIVDTQHQGSPEYAYRLRISAPRPDFVLRVVPSSINLRAGGTVPVTLYALRYDGFTNSITVALKDAPSGFRLSGTSISATQDQVRITLTAPPMPQKQPVQLNIEGRATIDGNVVVRPAVPAEDMMQAFAYRHLVPSKELRVGIGGRFQQRGVVKILSELPVKLPAGGTVGVKLNIPEKILVDRKVAFELSEPPAGITIQKILPSAASTEIILASESEKVKTGQKGNLIIKASAKRSGTPTKSKSKTNKQDSQMSTLPAVPFEIVSK
ncbi:MAG: PPC domain-containing protein [Kiritimatiellae bacterium]|nr:PPC domain-containing protein [Kiritimatiellia bacterium]MDD5521969.1 PPC domain-containing protein [Kiritimatiellia bacterium]